MMTTANPDKTLYGMVTDGGLYMFIKLVKQEPAIYDFSDIFSLLLFRQNKLYDVLRVLKRLGTLMQEG